jgi:hypothetical protein
MQLALTPEVLVLVGAGAALLLVVLTAVLAVRRRSRARARTTVADAVRGTTEPDATAFDGAGPPLRAADGAEPGPAERVESGRTVAAAVAQALAVREARGRASAPPAAGPRPDTDPARVAPAVAGPASDPGYGAAVWQEPAPPGRGDARDRLLAVLLDDPVRAVGATVELEACRRQLDRLTDSVRHERRTLAAVLARLAESGLAPDQLARLSGLSDEELRSLLADRVNAPS